MPSDAHTQATRAGTHLYFRLKQQMCTINLGQIALETFLSLPPSGLVPSLPLFLPCLPGEVGGVNSQLGLLNNLCRIRPWLSSVMCAFRSTWILAQSLLLPCPPLHTLVIILPAFIVKRNGASCLLKSGKENDKVWGTSRWTVMFLTALWPSSAGHRLPCSTA